METDNLPDYIKREGPRKQWLIERDPAIRFGQPQIKGIAVDDIYCRFMAGDSIPTIKQAWNHLTMPDIEMSIRNEILRRNANRGEDYYPLAENVAICQRCKYPIGGEVHRYHCLGLRHDGTPI